MKNAQLNLRLSPDDLALLRLAAQQAGASVAEVVRRGAIAAAREILRVTAQRART